MTSATAIREIPGLTIEEEQADPPRYFLSDPGRFGLVAEIQNHPRKGWLAIWWLDQTVMGASDEDDALRQVATRWDRLQNPRKPRWTIDRVLRASGPGEGYDVHFTGDDGGMWIGCYRPDGRLWMTVWNPQNDIPQLDPADLERRAVEREDKALELAVRLP